MVKLLPILMMIAMSGCYTAGISGDIATCASEADCESWQRCDTELDLCVRDETYNLCTVPDVSGYDPCGVGLTCEDTVHTRVCAPRPFRIGIIHGLSLRRSSPSQDEIVAQYMVDDVINPALQRTDQSVELIYKRVDRLDAIDYSEGLAELRGQDLDVLITLQSSAYVAAKEEFADTGVLILGRFNRRADAVREELENGFESLTTRSDFSLIPLQRGLLYAFGSVLGPELGCDIVHFVRSGDNETDLLSRDFLVEASETFGFCLGEDILLPKDSIASYDSYIDRVSTSENTCLFDQPSSDITKAEFFEAFRQARTDRPHVFLNEDILTSPIHEEYRTELKDFPNITYWERRVTTAEPAEFLNAFLPTYEAEWNRCRLEFPTCEAGDTDCVPCTDEVCVECTLSSPENLLRDELAVAGMADLMVLATLPIISTEFEDRFDHRASVESFLEWTTSDRNGTVCSPIRFDACIDRAFGVSTELDVKGLSSSLKLGTDGRMESQNQRIDFFSSSTGPDLQSFSEVKKIDESEFQRLIDMPVIVSCNE